MNSIRINLLGYFLILLLVALGGFSFFLHENARSRLERISASTHLSLSQNNERTNAILREGYQTTELILRTNFDQMLLDKAQRLASHLARQIPSRRDREYSLRCAGAMATACTLPQGFGMFALPMWVSDEPNGGSLWRTTSLARVDLQFIDDQRPRSREEQSVEFFQIYNAQGDVLLTSKSLGQDRFNLSSDASSLGLLSSSFDNVALPPMGRLRQVTLKAPVLGESFRGFDYRPRKGPPSEPRKPRTYLVLPADADEIARARFPTVFIQYARPTSEIDEVLAELRHEQTMTKESLARDLAGALRELDIQSQAELATLRTKLLVVSVVTFLASILGGIWLVSRGLAPLERIAVAVSRISERDFQLKLDERAVPRELEPVVTKLQETLTSLGSAFAREKQAAADISHDLRTPIAALLATTQVCLRKPRTSDEYRQALEGCAEIGKQLNTLVERLLTLARLDAGVDHLRNELVDVPEVAAQCVALVRPLAEEKGVAVDLQRNGPALVETDPGKLREVITNLLDNAIQYNRPHGRVDVSIHQQGQAVQLAIKDTGIGIPPEGCAHLFERFYRVDPSRQSDQLHAGLGLSIVKGYLDLMGGEIAVDSVLGQGTTFRIALPAAVN